MELPPQSSLLNSQDCVIVEISFKSPVCLERYSDFPALGRFVLRLKTQRVAFGVVTDLLE